MRILLLSSMVPDPDGAGAIPILLHAQILALSERHDVTLVTAAGDEPGERDAAAGLAKAGFDAHVADRGLPAAAGDRWRRRGRLASTWARSGRPWRTVWFADPALQGTIDRLAANRHFDLVAVEDNAMSVFRLPRGVPAVLTEHEVRQPRRIDMRGRRLASPHHLLREIDWRRWQQFQRASWRRFDRLQVFSDRDAAAMARLAPDVADRIRVNPFGLSLPPVPDPRREVAGTILFVGSFAHQPNRDAAVWLAREIMPAVRERHEEGRLLIVGNSPPREVVELAGPGVEVAGDAPSVEPHLAAASVVVAPLRTGGGMRMKVLQAMAAAKPVITTPRGTEGFTALDPEPPIVVAESAERIAAAAAGLLADAAGRRELGERGREFAERHHSPAAWGARLERVYGELLVEESGVRA